MKHKTAATYLLLGLSALLYVLLGYATPRTDFTQLLLLYAACFAAFAYLINRRFPIWLGIGAAIFYRLLLLFATPLLSDDYFRLIWDGRVLAAGLNPYFYLPSSLVTDVAHFVPGITNSLFQQLSNPELYSLHLPVVQATAWLSATISESVSGSIIVIRVVILLAEAASILLLLRLLRKTGMPDRNVLLYALNPLVILELTGNLHLEALMIFFMLMAVYQLFYQRVLVAGGVFALATGVNLLPLLFLPFIWRRLGTRKFALFGASMLLIVVVIFYPLLNWNTLTNILLSLSAYLKQMEFNASAYYLIRWATTGIVGEHLIIAGSLFFVTVALVSFIALSRKLGSVKRMMGYMASAYTIYLLLATIVQPWYIAPLVALTVPSHFRFAIVWSGMAILSYAAYRTPTVREDTALIILEYSVVLLWLIVELYLYRQRAKHVNLH